MKSKLGFVFALMCVASFFLYRMGENNKVNSVEKEDLLKGVVINATTQEPIMGVTIAVSGTNPRSRSDENGSFIVLGRTSDDFILKHPDYKSIIVSGKDLKMIRMQPKENGDN